MKSKMLSLIPVGIGGLIYLFYRSQDVILVRLSLHSVDGLRQLLQENFWPGDFIVYSVPGALWCVSYLLYMRNSSFKFHLLLITLMSIGSEFLQGLGVLPGSMTWPDIFAYAMGILLGSIGFYHKQSRYAIL